MFCAAFTGLFVIFSFAKNFIPNKFERLTHGIIGTLTAVLTTFLFLKFDRKRFFEIGLTYNRNTVINFFTGVIAGVIVMGCMVMSVMQLSNADISINPASNFLHFLLVTLPLIPLAFMEELGFRAYPLEILKDKIGIRLSIIITSILFALYHIANGWPMATSFLGPGIWGLIFGLAAIYSRGIAMPTGIHYAVNLATSAFGAANNTVSIWIVHGSSTSILKHQGVDWAAILPALALLIFAIICLELYMRRKSPQTTTWQKKG